MKKYISILFLVTTLWVWGQTKNYQFDTQWAYIANAGSGNDTIKFLFNSQNPDYLKADKDFIDFKEGNVYTSRNVKMSKADFQKYQAKKFNREFLIYDIKPVEKSDTIVNGYQAKKYQAKMMLNNAKTNAIIYLAEDIPTYGFVKRFLQDFLDYQSVVELPKGVAVKIIIEDKRDGGEPKTVNINLINSKINQSYSLKEQDYKLYTEDKNRDVDSAVVGYDYREYYYDYVNEALPNFKTTELTQLAKKIHQKTLELYEVQSDSIAVKRLVAQYPEQLISQYEKALLSPQIASLPLEEEKSYYDFSEEVKSFWEKFIHPDDYFYDDYEYDYPPADSAAVPKKMSPSYAETHNIKAQFGMDNISPDEEYVKYLPEVCQKREYPTVANAEFSKHLYNFWGQTCDMYLNELAENEVDYAGTLKELQAESYYIMQNSKSLSASDLEKVQKFLQEIQKEGESMSYNNDAPAVEYAEELEELADPDAFEIGEMPVTGNAKVDEFLKSYDKLVNDLMDATANKDNVKVAELTQKAQKLAAGNSLLNEVEKLPEDVKTKLQEYFQSKTKEMMMIMQNSENEVE